jgi:hypothetical protein
MKTISTINKVAGDYKPGDLVAIAGPSLSGKTNYLIYESVHAALNGNKILYCSVEMNTSYVVERIEQCMQSLRKSKKDETFGMGIYSKKAIKKVDMLIRRFSNVGKFPTRLSNFLKTLDKKGKKPDAVFIDSVEMLLTAGYGSAADCFTRMKNMLENLKAVAEETNTVIFVNLHTYMQYPSKESDISQSIKELFDFVFLIRNKGKKTFSNENNFEIEINRANKKDKKIVLKGSFDFEKLNLKFLDFYYDYDEIAHDLSNQFKDFSVVLSPEMGYVDLFLLNLSEMYSKTGKNVFHISREMTKDAEFLPSMLGENGKCITDDGDWVFEKNIGKKYFSINYPTDSKEFLSYLDVKIKSIKNLDYIIIDNIDNFNDGDRQSFAEFIQKVYKISTQHDICIIVGSEAIKGLKPNEINIQNFSKTIIGGYTASFVLGLREFTPSFLENIFQPKGNILLSILKNRTGKTGLKFLGKIESDKLCFSIIRNISD